MLEVEVRHVWAGFRLELSLNISREILVLFGRSGAGKTLTLRAVAGLFRPEAGHIVLGGRVLFDSKAGVNLPPQARRVGYVPQGYALFPHLSVFDNVAYGLRGKPEEVRRQVFELLDLVGLRELADRRPQQLSGGQQQRVALARALAVRPEVLLLDEPLSALDVPTRLELQGLIRDLQRQFGIPTLFVTHNLAEAMFLADRLAVVDRGRLLQVGPPKEVLNRPAQLEAAHLMGVRNIFHGRVSLVSEGGLRVRVGERDLLARPAATPAGLRPGDPVWVCVRAERIALVLPERLHRAADANLVLGEITREADYGLASVLYFRLTGPRLSPNRDYDLEVEVPAYVHERLRLDRVRTWTLAVDPEAVHLIPQAGAV